MKEDWNRVSEGSQQRGRPQVTVGPVLWHDEDLGVTGLHLDLRNVPLSVPPCHISTEKEPASLRIAQLLESL